MGALEQAIEQAGGARGGAAGSGKQAGACERRASACRASPAASLAGGHTAASIRFPALPSPPSQVEYREKLCAVGRIPSTYNKREGAAKEHEVLAARRIDRALRPLFPRGLPFDAAVGGARCVRLCGCGCGCGCVWGKLLAA